MISSNSRTSIQWPNCVRKATVGMTCSAIATLSAPAIAALCAVSQAIPVIRPTSALISASRRIDLRVYVVSLPTGSAIATNSSVPNNDASAAMHARRAQRQRCRCRSCANAQEHIDGPTVSLSLRGAQRRSNPRGQWEQ
jgi:hypothetical protein